MVVEVRPPGWVLDLEVSILGIGLAGAALVLSIAIGIHGIRELRRWL